MLSVVIKPVIYVIVALSIIGVLSLCYLFKDQLEEIKTHIRKTNILHKKLKKYCKNHDYILLTNLILPTSDGKKIKVDDLVIADKYIYVEKSVNNTFYADCWISFPFNGRESSGCSYNNAGTGWYYQ